VVFFFNLLMSSFSEFNLISTFQLSFYAIA
jgi:hypothetical protein